MTIQITSPSRLHFGFLDLSNQYYKGYGGIGLTIQKPSNKFYIEKADKTIIENGNENIKRKVSRITDYFDIPGLKIDVESQIPSHKGFGSGTSTTLSILSAVKELYKPKLNIDKTAAELGRFKQSRIGYNAFKHGGFILEMGQPKKIYRENFPENWRILIAIPPGKGQHGEKEKKAIKQTLPTDKEYTEKVSSEILARMIPSIGNNINQFGRSLDKIQREMGKTFEKAQGGIYSTKKGHELVKELRKTTLAVGQTSWGPTIYAIHKPEKIEEAKQKAQKIVENVFTTKPNNKGAEIKKIN